MESAALLAWACMELPPGMVRLDSLISWGTVGKQLGCIRICHGLHERVCARIVACYM